MIERLLENWLIRANERSFQIPFCHWLAYKGHTVVHLSRHCAMEMGKDVLTVAPDGVPCAYQLKGVEGGGRMTLSKWREDIEHQLLDLVYGRVVHPSIPSGLPHRAHVVINGELDEEVARAVDDFNRASADRGLPDRRVEVIVKGQLFRAFRELQSDFWATNLGDLKTYLELYLQDGRGQLPKPKLSRLFQTALPLETDDDNPPSRNEIAKAIAGCAIICASSISSFTNAKNHLAEFEAWTMFWGYVLAVAEKWDLALRQVQFAIDVALESMYSALARLCDELIERGSYSEGDILTDRWVYEVRMTQVLGLMGIYGLWRVQRMREGLKLAEDDEQRGAFLRKFNLERARNLRLWGEYAVPQFLAYNFFRRTFDPTLATDVLYRVLIESIVQLNGCGEGKLPNPYYDPESVLPHLVGVATDDLEDSFRGSSYYLEGLLHLFVRTNLKQTARWIFPSITRMSFRHHASGQPWRYYLYRDKGGTNYQRFLEPPHKWSELRNQAAESRGDDLPKLIKEYPIPYLAFLTVYPHRVNASGLRWLSSRLLEVA